ncbi:MAG TPA: DUF4873 domain-containing protein [Nocardioidaceae bacterium]|nr:DUF4873 domain-containing protein [Nocardioidaceae bacterium]
MSQQTPTDEGYDGPAELLADDAPVLQVSVTLRGVFQPIDGRYHWYGRVAAHDGIDDLVRSGASVVLRTPHGEAAGRLADRDTWGRYRISATGVPPFEHGS